MKKARIVEKISPDGSKSYVIQQRHFIFRWWWVAASVNSFSFADCRDTFWDIETARRHLCYFDGTPTIEAVVE